MHEWSRHPAIRWGLVVGLITAHFLLAFCSARKKSPTPDEYSYIATGYLYVTTGDLRLDRTHPPLIRYLIGLPLLWMDIQMPPLHEELWDTAESYFLGYRIGWEMLLGGVNRWEPILSAARLPIMLLSCLLAWLIYGWARELYGESGALVSLFFYCFCPNVLAHARLATMDVGLSFFFVAALFFLHRFWKTRQRREALLTGVLLGCALAAKVTAVLLLPILIAALVWTLRQDKKTSASHAPKTILRFSLILFISFLTLLFVYGFPGKPCYYLDTVKNVVAKTSHGGAGGEEIPGMPHLNYAFYLFGDYSTQGWPHYFLLAALVKTPLAVFGALALILLWGQRRWQGFPDLLILGGIAILHVAAVFNHVNIGLRHILPFYPLLFLYLGRIVEIRYWPILRWITLILAIWYVSANLSIYPDYLTYFNELAGGPARGHEFLDDSNLDWGQDLGRLVEIQRRFPDEPLYVATNWMFGPQAFHVNAELLRKEQILSPPKGIVAVGKHWAIRNRRDTRSPYYFDWWEKYKPVGNLGHSIVIFRFE